jgi:hypothetical protein
LLLTDVARPPIRQAKGVELVTEVATTAKYYGLCQKLLYLGFREDMEVIGRWSKGPLLIDVLPSDESVLGITNRWHAPAIRNASAHILPSRRRIRLIRAPYFLAAKLESFRMRGCGDFLHHDIEDIVNLVDGRQEIAAESRSTERRLREFLAQEFEGLLGDVRFVDHLPGHFGSEKADQDRIARVLRRFRQIAAW